jgi:hypothetical protein
MRHVRLSACLLLASCLSRTELGQVPGDAGSDANGDVDADMPSVRTMELEAFVRDLAHGPWRGKAFATGQDPVLVELSFELDGRYVARCLEPQPGANPCLPFPYGLVEDNKPGQYWITDHTTSGEYWGRTLDDFQDRGPFSALLDHMTIAHDTLTFVRRQELDVISLGSAVLVLERVP